MRFVPTPHGPYPQKKNNYNPGISLTIHRLIFCLFLKLILPAWNNEYKVRKSMESWICFHFTIIYFPILFLKQQEKINMSFWSDLFLE